MSNYSEATIAMYDETLAANISMNVTLNDSDADPMWMYVSPRVAKLRLANQITLTIIMFSMMVGMGCAITLKEVKNNLRRPWGLLIGAFCQYGILPLLSFTLAHMLRLHPAYAIGMLVVSCSPGGMASNMLTYWVQGDVSLSICMTTSSTFLAFGMMPLCLFLYSRSWVQHEGIPAIPYMDIIIALVCILLPVVVGMLIRYRWEKKAGIVSRVGGILGMIGIIISLTLQGLVTTAPYRAPWRLWAAAFMLPLAGYGLSYLFARLCKMDTRRCRTVGIETGMQNVAVALTVMALSFRDAGPMVKVFPAVYTLVQSLFVLVMVPLAVFYRRIWSNYRLEIRLVRRETPEEKKKRVEAAADVSLEEEDADDDAATKQPMMNGTKTISNGDIKSNCKLDQSKEENDPENYMSNASDLSESRV
ncbi:ileal sodium/bile acid cotransporter-like [Glandiceps talaboti]